MRFGIFTSILLTTTFVAGAAFAQTAHDFSDYISLSKPTPITEPRLQKGRQVSNLTTPDTLLHTLYARRLGAISAVTETDGTIFVADKNSGIIHRLPDRNGDGITEGVRPMPHRFDAPTGLAILDGTLYVADRNAIWRVGPTGSPQKLAGLTEAGSTGAHVLRAGAKDHLWLGMTTLGGQARLLKVSTMNGQAELVDETAGRLADISELAGPRPWLLIEKSDGFHLGPSADILTPIGADAAHLWIPQGADITQNWPPKLSQHIMVSRPVFGDVIAIPTLVAKPLPLGKPVFTGFNSASGRTAWGQSGPLLMNRQGLFVADTVNGDLWRIQENPEPPAPVVITPETDETTKEAPVIQETLTGEEAEDYARSTFSSSITNLSTIKRGSLLDKASTLERASMLEPTKPIKKDEARDAKKD